MFVGIQKLSSFFFNHADTFREMELEKAWFLLSNCILLHSTFYWMPCTSACLVFNFTWRLVRQHKKNNIKKKTSLKTQWRNSFHLKPERKRSCRFLPPLPQKSEGAENPLTVTRSVLETSFELSFTDAMTVGLGLTPRVFHRPEIGDLVSRTSGIPPLSLS